MFRVGDYVEVTEYAKRRFNCRHLNSSYKIMRVDKDIITFWTGEKVNRFSYHCREGERRWLKHHLKVGYIIQENE